MNDELIQRIGIAKSCWIGVEDHGIFTMQIAIEYDNHGGHQCFGGYALDQYDKKLKARVGSAPGCDFIMRVLSALNVGAISGIENIPVIAYLDKPGLGGMVRGIRRIGLGEDKRFLISDWQKYWKCGNE